MKYLKSLLLIAIVFFSLLFVFQIPISAQSDASTYLYSFAHLSEPEVDTNNGQDRVYFENQTKWLAQQPHIKAVIITGDFMGYGDWYNLTAGTINETVWGWVKEGIDRLRNAGKVVIPVLGNWDAFYNQSYDGGKGDCRAFMNYALAPAGISSSTPNYTLTLDGPIKLFFVVLTYRWWMSAEGVPLWGIREDQITWMSAQLNSTSLPAVIALHSPPTKYALAYRDQGVNDAVWAEASKHSNVFLILHGHDHDRNFRIYEAMDGHPIYVEGKLLPWSQYGGQAEIQIYDIYTDRIRSYTFSPWLNRYFTGYEGDAFEMPFRGIMKSKSGLLKRNDFSSRQGSETGGEYRTPRFNYADYISSPSSVDLGYNDLVKRFIPKHHKTFWLQTYRKFDSGGGAYINFWQTKDIEQLILSSGTKVIGGNLYFYPNMSDTSKNVAVSTSDWYSLIYSIDENAQATNVYLFLENGVLVKSWHALPYISMVGYGMKEVRFREYVRMDDYIVTNGTQVSLPLGTILTLPNGTTISPNGTLNLLDFGTLVLRDVTVQIGDQTKVMDLYGGDSVQKFNLGFWPTPIASFTYLPNKPTPNETITFDASTSYDPNGYIANYTWDFGDGDVITVIDPIITHAYPKLGTFLINLTVTDNDGLTDSKIDYITVKYMHDIAVTNVTVSTPQITKGENVSIEVYVTNEGANPETYGVTACYNDSIIEIKAANYIETDSNVVVSFIWDTVGVTPGNYTIWAEVSILEGETDTTDNRYVDDTVMVNKKLSTIYISASPKIIKLGSETTLSGYINPKQTGADVTISYSLNGGTWTMLTTVTTNEQGSYAYVWKPQEIGTYTLRANWSGTIDTLGDESNIGTIIVEANPPSSDITPYAAVGGIIVIAAIAALVYFWRVKKPKKNALLSEKARS